MLPILWNRQGSRYLLGSITDNHKINLHFCKLFDQVTDLKANHPFDSSRSWYLLNDSVHIIKCIRNNWITQRSPKNFQESVGDYSYMKDLSMAEKDSILKTTTLRKFSICPSKLHMQNVQLVVKVFNSKVAAALRVQGAMETANLVQLICNWW